MSWPHFKPRVLLRAGFNLIQNKRGLPTVWI